MHAFAANAKLRAAALGGIALLSFFGTLWVDSANLMESRNFVTAREIVASGDWVVTTLNGEYRFEKPPLPSWTAALLMKGFHNFHSEALLRLPAALTSLLLVFLMHKMVKRLGGDGFRAFLSAAILATSFMVMKVGTENTWDVFGYAFGFGVAVCWVEWLQAGGALNLVLAALFCAASLLGKGPVGFYALLLPFPVAYGLAYGRQELKRKWPGLLLSLLAGLLLAGVWPLLLMRGHADLFFAAMGKEELTWSTRHSRSFFYYANFFAYTGVWMFFTLFTLWKKWSAPRAQNKALFNFGYWWLWLSLLLVSIVKMKKQRYGLPLYIVSPLAVGEIVHYYFGEWKDGLARSDRALLALHYAFIALLLCALPVLFVVKGAGPVGWPGVVLLALGYLALLGVWLKHGRPTNPGRAARMILASGAVAVAVNLSAKWFFEWHVGGDRRTDLPALEELQKSPRGREIYSADFAITDVWNAGQRIHPLDAGPLPAEFDLLAIGEFPAVLKPAYDILEKADFYRVREESQVVSLYHLRQKRP